jgi:hypothetical protein
MVPEGMPENWLGGLSLRGTSICEPADLPGYNKKAGHRAPVEHGVQAETLLREWGAPRIEALATRLHTGLRQALGLKRADIKVDLSAGAIRMCSPVAEVRCWLEQDPSQAARALECVEVDHLSSPELLDNAQFLSVFSKNCNRLHWQPTAPVDVEGLIDHLESEPEHARHLEYPLDASWLRFTPPPGGLELYCDAQGMSFTCRDKECAFPDFVAKAFSLFPLISGLHRD